MKPIIRRIRELERRLPPPASGPPGPSVGEQIAGGLARVGWVHGRRDEEGRLQGRVLQARGRRADLPNQLVASPASFLARPASAAAGFFFGPLRLFPCFRE